MKSLRNYFTSFALLLFVLLIGYISCNSTSQKREGEERSASQNYISYCAGCHGDNLEKFEHKVWMDEEGTASIEKSIKEGILEIGMPAFEKTFTDAEIKALALYVKKGIPADRETLKPSVHADQIIESEEHRFVMDTVVLGLDVPWGLAFCQMAIY